CTGLPTTASVGASSVKSSTGPGVTTYLAAREISTNPPVPWRSTATWTLSDPAMYAAVGFASTVDRGWPGRRAAPGPRIAIVWLNRSTLPLNPTVSIVTPNVAPDRELFTDRKCGFAGSSLCSRFEIGNGCANHAFGNPTRIAPPVGRPPDPIVICSSYAPIAAALIVAGRRTAAPSIMPAEILDGRG